MVPVPEKTALVIVDMLNDFVKEGGSLIVPEAVNLIPIIKRRQDDARSQGIPIIYLTDAHRPDDPEFEMWPPHAVPGTWGQQVIDELKPQSEDYVLPKRRYSGFFGTQLELVLRELGVDTLIITGVLTNICVFFTAIHAKALAYRVIVPKDSVASTSKEDHEWALRQMKDLHGIEVI